ncbi:MAG: D-alanine--D-alanine ligase [Patescibacteria group bacterium]
MIAVLTGGNSSERTVALWSAETVVAALRSLKLDHQIIDCAEYNWQERISYIQPQLVILALHGKFGEDGQIQKILEKAGIPYTGSGPMACRLSWNKLEAKLAVQKLGFQTPKWSVDGSANQFPDPPVVVKPSQEGSSFGVTIVRNHDQLLPAIRSAKKFGPEVLVEELIGGTELSCGVIDLRGSVEALPVIEIVPKNEFFDFKAKYDGISCDEIVPARISDDMTKQIQSFSEEIFRQFGCRHYARIDWMLRDKTPYFLELNVLPGLTKNSLINKELLKAGISFESFIELLTKRALF